VLELDHREPFGGGQPIEGAEERGLVGVRIEERPHDVRAQLRSGVPRIR